MKGLLDASLHHRYTPSEHPFTDDVYSRSVVQSISQSVHPIASHPIASSSAHRYRVPAEPERHGALPPQAHSLSAMA